MVTMKWTLPLLLVLLLACSDGDDKRATATTTTTTTPTAPTTPTTEVTAAAAACFTFEEVDRGASVTVYGVYDCDWNPLELNGEPAAFPVGGTVTHAEGLRCEEQQLVVLAAASDDGETYQATETSYRVEGNQLVPTGEVASGVVTGADIAPFYELDCS
jgi:hypothetical protein